MPETLGALAKIHYGKSPSDVVSADGEVPVVGTGGIYAKATCALFDRGVVVARKGSLGTPHLLRSPFWPSDTTYAVVPMPGIDIEWLYYCLLNFDLTKLNEATGVPSISRDWLAKTPFHNPGGAQQKRIAAILTSLDTAIEKTEALIEKHQQIKAGLMHDLFTRGVLPNGQLRPPQEQAPELYKQTVLGDFPLSWKVTELADACEAVIDCPHSTPSFGQDGVLVARTMHIKKGVFIEELASRVSEAEYRERVIRLEPRAGDVIFTREAPVGEAFVIPQGMRVCLGQRVMLIRPKSGALNGTYLVAQVYSGLLQARIADLVSGTTNPHLNVADVRALQIPLPPKAEQDQVSACIDVAAEQLNREQGKLQKLRKQKLGLMQDLLTGKAPVKVEVPAAEPADA